MNPDCPYCGFKDNAQHECFPEAARKVIDERTAWYHDEWKGCSDAIARVNELEAKLSLAEQVVKTAENLIEVDSHAKSPLPTSRFWDVVTDLKNALAVYRTPPP